MRRTEEDIEDELLVLRCQGGDEAALRDLVARWQPRLARVARQLTGDREAARDVLQDAWLAIARGIKRLDDPARFRTWAYRILTNRCTDWVRRRMVRRRFVEAQKQASVDAGAETTSGADLDGASGGVRAALAALPDEQRSVVVLHYSVGMGIREIARVLGVPSGTVKSRLFHARERLRAVLERTES